MKGGVDSFLLKGKHMLTNTEIPPRNDRYLRAFNWLMIQKYTIVSSYMVRDKCVGVWIICQTDMQMSYHMLPIGDKLPIVEP